MRKSINIILKKNILIILLMISMCPVLGFSYARFVINTDSYRSNEMYMAELLYTVKIDDISTYTLTLEAGAYEEEHIIEITSLNAVSTNYKLIYQNNSNVKIEYASDYIDPAFGGILTKRTIMLRLTNNTDINQTLSFSVIGGYSFNSLDEIDIPSGYTEVNIEYWKYDYETTALYVNNTRVEQLDSSKYYELSNYTCSNGEIVEYDRLYKKITIDSNKQTKCSLYFNEVFLNPNDYVKRNLVFMYDGEYNTSSGHNNSSTSWYDWSGNSNTGTLNGPVWGSNYLEFDGVNDWVKIGQHNYNQYEIQIVFESNNVTPFQTIIANYENGGYGVNVENSTVQNEIFISSSYVYTNSNVISNNTIYSISSTFDISNSKIYINNNLNATTSINNIMGKTTISTILAIGANPGGSIVTNGYFNGKIYSVRFYNFVLTDEERTYNYNIDRIRFGL